MASLGSTPGIIVGVGVGAAASTAIEPALEIPKQEAWKRNTTKLLPTGTLAALIAQGGVPLGSDQYDDANRDGYSDDKLDALVYLAQTVPGFAELLTLWRRNPDFGELWSHGLRKNAIDARYLPYLDGLKIDRLDPAVIANAIVRGIMDAPFPLPVPPPSEVGKVKAFPTSKLDTTAEALASGIDTERLFVMTAIDGRPPGPELAARASFRQIIDRVDYDRAISEGDVRNEWADSIYEVSREILTSNQYAELQLRGYIDEATRRTKTGQHGMSTGDSDLLYDLLGRSIPVHQITTGEARGGTFDGPIDTIPKAYLQSLQRGNLRPEYYNLAYANRYSLPSAFVLRALLQDGAITQEQGEQYFLDVGWPPDLAKAVAKAYAPAPGATATDPYVKKAQSQLWTALHKAYVKAGAGKDEVDGLLVSLIPDVAERGKVFSLWDAERLADKLPAAAA